MHRTTWDRPFYYPCNCRLGLVADVAVFGACNVHGSSTFNYTNFPPFQAALLGLGHWQPVLIPPGRGHLIQAGQEAEVQAAAVGGDL